MGKRYRAPSTPGPIKAAVLSGDLRPAVARGMFIVPDETPRPVGKRTMVVGRKSYSWMPDRPHTKAEEKALRERPARVTDGLSDEDDGSTHTMAMATDGTEILVIGQPACGLTMVDIVGRREMLSRPVRQDARFVVERTVAMGDAPLPTIRKGKPAKPAKPAKVKASTPAKGAKSKAAPSGRATTDAQIRAIIAKVGGPQPTKITPQVRHAALALLEGKRQRREYAK